MSSAGATDLTITLHFTNTGQSESLPLTSSTTIQELLEWSRALFSVDDQTRIAILKDGQAILNPQLTLEAANVKHGDLLAVTLVQPQQQAQQQQSTVARAPSGGGGGLDFSSLLAGGASATAPAGAGGMDFSALLGGAAPAAAAATTSADPPPPVYYPGMNLNEAMQYNSHPQSFISLLQSKDHLQKELNYHNPPLAAKLVGKSLLEATDIWRQELVKSGIQNAFRATNQYHKEQEMTRRMKENPDDPEAKLYFNRIKKKGLVQEQYIQMMNEYPEALGRVLMLYISCKINGHEIQAFCDSGAQATIMSETIAKECGIDDLIDTRFAGMAVGVGTGKIVGRIHMVQLQIGQYYFPCSVTVMESPAKAATAAFGGIEDDAATAGKEMPFLLGLDMMKRHTCCIDLETGVLKFRLAPGQYMETPFLHEKDLNESQGGTRGFNADVANQKLLVEMEEQEKRAEQKKKDGNGKKDVEGDDDEDAMET